MMKTATDFATQVKKCEKAIRAAHAANAELLSTTKATMAMPLPQTYEDSNAGAGGAAAVALHQVRVAPGTATARPAGCAGPCWAQARMQRAGDAGSSHRCRGLGSEPARAAG